MRIVLTLKMDEIVSTLKMYDLFITNIYWLLGFINWYSCEVSKYNLFKINSALQTT